MEEPFSQLYQLSQRYICVLLGGMLESSGSSFGSQLRLFVGTGIATGPVTRSPSNSQNIAGTVVVEKTMNAYQFLPIITEHLYPHIANFTLIWRTFSIPASDSPSGLALGTHGMLPHRHVMA